MALFLQLSERGTGRNSPTINPGICSIGRWIRPQKSWAASLAIPFSAPCPARFRVAVVLNHSPMAPVAPQAQPRVTCAVPEEGCRSRLSPLGSATADGSSQPDSIPRRKRESPQAPWRDKLARASWSDSPPPAALAQRENPGTPQARIPGAGPFSLKLPRFSYPRSALSPIGTYPGVLASPAGLHPDNTSSYGYSGTDPPADEASQKRSATNLRGLSPQAPEATYGVCPRKRRKWPVQFSKGSVPARSKGVCPQRPDSN